MTEHLILLLLPLLTNFVRTKGEKHEFALLGLINTKVASVLLS